MNKTEKVFQSILKRIERVENELNPEDNPNREAFFTLGSDLYDHEAGKVRTYSTRVIKAFIQYVKDKSERK